MESSNSSVSNLPTLFIFRLLDLQLPPIQVPHADTQVRRKAQPSEIRCHAPCRAGVELAVQVGQVDVGAKQGHDVDRGGDGFLEAEEDGRPNEVQGQLDRVDGRGVARGGEGLWAAEGREAVEPGAVGGVAHQAVEEGPGWAKQPGRRGEGRLAEPFVGFLGFLVFDRGFGLAQFL